MFFLFFSFNQTKIDFLIFFRYSTANSITPNGGRIVVFGDSSCFDDIMDGPGCRHLLRDLIFYSNSLSKEVLSKYLIPITSTDESVDSSKLPQRPIRDDDSEYFSRLNDGEQPECTYRFFKEPKNLRGDPIDILWQVSIIYFYFLFSNYEIATHVCTKRI